jgi:NMD protein affecting ribosome stability and mRNA decay
MSEYCHNCGDHISDDIEKLCRKCKEANTLRLESADGPVTFTRDADGKVTIEIQDQAGPVTETIDEADQMALAEFLCEY